MFSRSLPIIDDDPAWLDAPPESFMPALRSVALEAEPEGLGLRSLLERPEFAPKPPLRVLHSRSGSRV